MVIKGVHVLCVINRALSLSMDKINLGMILQPTYELHFTISHLFDKLKERLFLKKQPKPGHLHYNL